jgi:ABC-2 type transport system permease protein
MIDVPLILGVAILFFNVPMHGEFWELALSAFVFICASVSLGTLISTFAKNQQQAMMGGFMVLFPSIQLSGVMYPLDNIPAVIKWIPYLNPLKYFAVLIRNIMLKGGDSAVVWPNLAAMAILAAIMITVSFRRFGRTLN